MPLRTLFAELTAKMTLAGIWRQYSKKSDCDGQLVEVCCLGRVTVRAAEV